MSKHSSDIQKDLPYHSGPIDIIYGIESPVKLSDVARHISSAKKRRRPIEHLGFLGCRFYDDTRKVFRLLGRKLRRIRDVRELAIHGVSNVGNEELALLAPFLNANSTLRSLDLTGTTFDAEAIEGVGPFFRKNSSLERLVLGENQCVGDEGVATIMSALMQQTSRKRKRSSGLRVLAIESCGVGHSGASSISDMLCHATGSSLRLLELSNNDIGDAGAEALSGAIVESGHRLGHLGLNNAGIGDHGAVMFGEILKSNRSLHTLSLQKNAGITDVGASSLLEAVYDTDSVASIIGSNHVLRGLNLRGCSRISPKLLHLTNQLCGRMLCKEEDLIRLKISKHMASAECGVALEDFDLELMPRILSFVGKTSGMTSLFLTLKSLPILYTHYDPEAFQPEKVLDETMDEKEEIPASNATFLEQFKLNSRRARKYYTIFANLVPERSAMIRYQDRRIWNRHESTTLASAASNNSQHNLSSAATNTSGNTTSFVQLNLYYVVLKQALLLW
eukprot:CAMPEP_0201660690 /NCGR_PEP_ID=MMETSP0494-20130426/3280_1 /ASSEMBLY_ACC=CAM_ASM_000839 /TAXON_ID=420259 /ORGANISM="Thalassiosira gravida, Strain GMp14c1" /LENGTH=504 /DNA_ID=CAMNT_0048138637 /DNA_START=150 /DNA_END=1661 /DNA_ORIENTATION=+